MNIEHASKLAGAAEVRPSPDIVDPTRKRPERASRNTQLKQNKETLPLTPVCELIVQDAEELVMNPKETREISAVLSRKYGYTEPVIDRVLVRYLLAHRRAYSAQRTGQLNTMAIAGNVLTKTLTEAR